MAYMTYDFIVVGGGTAGLVLANRLTENSNVRVLVLEAGSDHSADPRIVTPALYTSLFGTEIDWLFKTELQAGLNSRTITVNQGKALGGSSSMNAQVFAPPLQARIDTWEEIGNDDWNFEAMRPYYHKALTLPEVDEASEESLGIAGLNNVVEACDGPVKLSFPGDTSHPTRKAWAEAFKDLGHGSEDSSIFGSSAGSFSCLTSIDPITKQRCSAASAYYHPVSHRGNLHLVTEATVEKIIFSSPSSESAGTDVKPRAVGVHYTHGGESRTAQCDKEVILAAGTFQSPKILELSGIGNSEILQKYGIEVLVDLPGVGENLQDHLACSIGFEAIDSVQTMDELIRQEPEAIGKAMNEYATAQSGWLTSMGLWGCAYVPATEYLSDSGRRALEDLLSQRPSSTSTEGDTADNLGVKARHEITEKGLLTPKHPDGMAFFVMGQAPDPTSSSPQTLVPGKFITLGSVLSHPFSTGTVHIQDRNATTPPHINPRYLSSQIDADVYGRNMLWLEKLASSPPLSSLLKQPLRHRTAASRLANLADAEQYVRDNAISMWHPVGTCAMMPQAKGGVVDTQLRVYGVAGLRVVDASIMPLVTTGNTQSTVYAVAERAADLIKATYASGD